MSDEILDRLRRELSGDSPFVPNPSEPSGAGGEGPPADEDEQGRSPGARPVGAAALDLADELLGGGGGRIVDPARPETVEPATEPDPPAGQQPAGHDDLTTSTPAAPRSPSAEETIVPTDDVAGALGPSGPAIHQGSCRLTVRGMQTVVTANRVVLGRARDAFNPSSDARVSRHHAVVLVHDGVVAVKDLRSKNGTQIRRAGGRIVVGEQPVAVQPGDVLTTTEDVELARIEGVEGIEGAEQG